ncbi:hypothetical protein [Amycolatopsis thermoflava]|uniref:hypothetical protein n=1 Tax=Amycolatopsis thermoflava TaxID=84480 RepID=UPI003D755837
MITTTDHHFEVFGDATCIDLADRYDDVLAEPAARNRELMALLAPSAITIPPSDLPAADLPDYEPTTADLLAIESWTDEDQIDARIAAANTLSAFEARHRDLLRLRAELPAPALADEPDELDLERAA